MVSLMSVTTVFANGVERGEGISARFNVPLSADGFAYSLKVETIKMVRAGLVISDFTIANVSWLAENANNVSHSELQNFSQYMAWTEAVRQYLGSLNGTIRYLDLQIFDYGMDSKTLYYIKREIINTKKQVVEFEAMIKDMSEGVDASLFKTFAPKDHQTLIETFQNKVIPNYKESIEKMELLVKDFELSNAVKQISKSQEQTCGK